MRYATWFGMLCCAGLTWGVSACSSKSDTSTSGGGGGTTAGPATSGGGMGATSGGGGMGGSAGVGGGGGQGGGGPNLVNGCDPATAMDLSGMNPTIQFPVNGLKYAPNCIKIAKGDSVTFSGSFADHPLAAGTIADGMINPDNASPIQSTAMGNMATFMFPNAGTFGFYCGFHGLSSGMDGAIFVQ